MKFVSFSERIRQDVDNEKLNWFGMAWLPLVIVPPVYPLVGFISSFANAWSPSGFIDALHKFFGLGMDVFKVLSDFQSGAYFENVIQLYTISVYMALAAFLLLLVVALLSTIPNFLSSKWAPLFEIPAVIIWGIPYWGYHILAFSILAIKVFFILAAFFIGLYTAFKTTNFIFAILAGLTMLGMLMLKFPVVIAMFALTFGPLYFVLRYGVSFGLVFGRPESIVNRSFNMAFVPFGED